MAPTANTVVTLLLSSGFLHSFIKITTAKTIGSGPVHKDRLKRFSHLHSTSDPSLSWPGPRQSRNVPTESETGPARFPNKFAAKPYSIRNKRKFLLGARTWDHVKDLNFVYRIDEGLNHTQQAMIEHALQEASEMTCLQFSKALPSVAFDDLNIIFMNGTTCSSSTGYRFISGPQGINLEESCFTGPGVVTHELMHVLGFVHEHSRPDRDQYISITWENIAPGAEGQYEKLGENVVLTAPAEYDYGSVMHYRSSTFSIREELPIIHTTEPEYQWTIGQRMELSFMDAKFINYVYCRDRCSVPVGDGVNRGCQRGGYVHPKYCDRCLCPSGFAGNWCELVKPGQNADCGGPLYLSATGQPTIITSPNFPNPYGQNQQCSWLATCPVGQRVKLDFAGSVIDVNCKPARQVCLDYVEVQRGRSFGRTGTRYCCMFLPTEGALSNANEMLILFRSFEFGAKTGFQAQLKCVL